MKLPARLFLAVLTLSIGTLTPIVPPPISLADSNVSDCCVKMDAGRCHSCPTNDDRDDFNFWVVMLRDPVGMLRTVFYESDAILFTSMQLIGTVGVNDERATTRTQRPPVPPPRGAFS